jgi:hypothetical protein
MTKTAERLSPASRCNTSAFASVPKLAVCEHRALVLEAAWLQGTSCRRSIQNSTPVPLQQIYATLFHRNEGAGNAQGQPEAAESTSELKVCYIIDDQSCSSAQ